MLQAEHPEQIEQQAPMAEATDFDQGIRPTGVIAASAEHLIQLPG